MKQTAFKTRLSVAALLFFGAMFFDANAPTLSAQDKVESSRREAETIKKISEAGGRVIQISSADASREASFYLAGKKITDAHLQDLGVVKNIKWLNLANTSVTNDGLKSIAGLNLQKLHLEKTGIGDAGLVHLKEMKDLEYLNLYATSVTDEGLKHLAGLTKLRKVYVWKSKVTEAGMKALEKQNPGVQVVGESKLPIFKPPTKEEKLAAREKELKQKEKNLNSKEESLKKREEALKKKEQDLKKAAEEKKE